VPRTSSLKTIRAKIRELEAKAAALEQAGKPGIDELKALVAKYRLRPADIKLAFAQRGTKKPQARSVKVKPKYRNPQDKSETWAGRGLKPRWLVALMKQGKSLEDFAI
jgi:DNA-binding protein H-NS